ncbi:hypothetical protein Q8A67_019473 [Cirrhinus molitorella]|uniref:Uncharacterized protein n=1 Tax=Cirrhinus molitorella TaxID=172907 RepID=A0AA88THZ5_9TELE|nr:hypothetical protein Q8A67_019473 [Cirrhinus molitorella]
MDDALKHREHHPQTELQGWAKKSGSTLVVMSVPSGTPGTGRTNARREKHGHCHLLSPASLTEEAQDYATIGNPTTHNSQHLRVSPCQLAGPQHRVDQQQWLAHTSRPAPARRRPAATRPPETGRCDYGSWHLARPLSIKQTGMGPDRASAVVPAQGALAVS